MTKVDRSCSLLGSGKRRRRTTDPVNVPPVTFFLIAGQGIQKSRPELTQAKAVARAKTVAAKCGYGYLTPSLKALLMNEAPSCCGGSLAVKVGVGAVLREQFVVSAALGQASVVQQ